MFFTFQLRNQTNSTYDGLQGCVAVLDNTGKVVFFDSEEITKRNTDGTIGPAVVEPQVLGPVFLLAKNVPVGPTQVRAWLWIGPKGAPTSVYQFISTEMITIQSVTP
jgi:hypothetical protein